MSWQKCPNCNGSGKNNTVIGDKCHVCNGYGIVSVLTGAPPCYKEKNNNFEGPTKL